MIELSAKANNLTIVAQHSEEYARLMMEELDTYNFGYIQVTNFVLLLILRRPSRLLDESLVYLWLLCYYYYWLSDDTEVQPISPFIIVERPTKSYIQWNVAQLIGKKHLFVTHYVNHGYCIAKGASPATYPLRIAFKPLPTKTCGWILSFFTPLLLFRGES